MSGVTKIIILLAFYAALFVLIRIGKKGVEANERRTFAVLALVWSVSMFIANYLGYVFGVMSFLPWWPNNFLHTFVWIGGGLSYLYLAVRRESPVVQFVAFATLSLVVKYAEQKIFGVWSMDHFLTIFRGNDAYIVGWSLVDGFYPMLSGFLLKLLSRWVRGLRDELQEWAAAGVTEVAA